MAYHHTAGLITNDLNYAGYSGLKKEIPNASVRMSPQNLGEAFTE